MDEIKEIIFYESHKYLFKDLQEFLLQHFTSTNSTSLPSEWATFAPVLKKMQVHSGSRVRHLKAYFSALAPKWTEYVTILNTMTELYRNASTTLDAFKFQLDHVENCWKGNQRTLSWNNIRAIEEVSKFRFFFCSRATLLRIDKQMQMKCFNIHNRPFDGTAKFLSRDTGQKWALSRDPGTGQNK